MRYVGIALLVICGIATAGEKVDAGKGMLGDFDVFDVSTKVDIALNGIWHARGQIVNNSGKDYKAAQFNLSFFDEKNKLVGVALVTILNFKQGEEAVFTGTSQDDISKWHTYKMRLNVGL